MTSVLSDISRFPAVPSLYVCTHARTAQMLSVSCLAIYSWCTWVEGRQCGTHASCMCGGHLFRRRGLFLNLSPAMLGSTGPTTVEERVRWSGD